MPFSLRILQCGRGTLGEVVTDDGHFACLVRVELEDDRAFVLDALSQVVRSARDVGIDTCVDALRGLNRVLFHARSKLPRTLPLATEVIACVVTNGSLAILQAGLASAWRFADGGAQSIAFDHSVRAGILNEDPEVVTSRPAAETELLAWTPGRALGFSDTVAVDVRVVPTAPRDRVVLVMGDASAHRERPRRTATGTTEPLETFARRCGGAPGSIVLVEHDS